MELIFASCSDSQNKNCQKNEHYNDENIELEGFVIVNCEEGNSTFRGIVERV